MTLLMRDQENMEKGVKEGLEKGIIALVSALKDLNIEDDIIIRKLQEKFMISEEEAKKYVVKL